MDEKSQKRKKEFPIKIGVLLVIIVLIGGVWVYKNMPQKTDEASPILSQSELDESSQETEEAIEGYFPLHKTDEINMEELKSYGLPIIIDFGADSCVPCKEMEPVLIKLNEELAGKAIILFVDVWKYQDLMTGYPVEVIPTQILIDAKGNPYTPSENITIQLIQYANRDNGEHVFTAHQGGLTEEQILTLLEEMGLNE